MKTAEAVKGKLTALLSREQAAPRHILGENVQGKRSKRRELWNELISNLALCWLVTKKQLEPVKAIPKLTTRVYNRLQEEGFDFNALSSRRRKIRVPQKIMDGDLTSFDGKDIASLIEAVYNRINELQLLYQINPENPRVNWKARFMNLHKRLLLLEIHLRFPGDPSSDAPPPEDIKKKKPKAK